MRRWNVWFEGRVKDPDRGWVRKVIGSVDVFARDRVEAQQLAFRRAPSAVLRPSDVSSGALWSYTSRVGV